MGDTSVDRGARLLIPLLALLLIAPLLVRGCSCGHDFDFHLLSWIEAAQQISHGNLHPHWAYTPAYNAGEPRFVFYPPVSWYLGAGIGLGLEHLPRMTEAAAWTAAPILFTWIALTLSGLSMFRLARRFAGANAALLASAVYLASPYMLFTAFERTAYAELLAAAWIPLLLEAVLRERPTIPGVAIPVALLWLTNAPAAVMGCYALALLTAVRLCVEIFASGAIIVERDAALRLSAQISGGATLGLALAAFYIVPAAWERRYVQAAMATVGGMSIGENFLFEHTGSSPDDLLHDQVLHTASVIAVMTLVVTFTALVLLALRRMKAASRQTRLLLPLLVLTAAISFALTPASAAIWRITPEAIYLQFPWRLLAVLAPAGALAIAIHLVQIERGLRHAHVALTAIILVAALGLPAWHLFRQSCDPEDTAAARVALFHSHAGTDPTDEYTPTAADNDALQPGNAPFWIGNSPTAPPPPGHPAGPAPMHLRVDAPRAESLVLNLRNYPAWRITRTTDGSTAQIIAAREPRPDGLVAIEVPAGNSIIDIHYAHTFDETLGDLISLCALVIAALLLRARYPSAATRP
ncbi:MAG TPA: hypothetical protein VG714_08710 [Acidobacteriaceae bacterium]|nr:hypothetical protein [Acidobacteriaceae bacterium]